MNLVRTVDLWPSGKEHIEWSHWVTRTNKEVLEGREADIAEEAYQQGLAAGEEPK